MLPESFLLAGAVDTAMAHVMWPDYLAAGWYTSGQDCAGVRWRSGGLLFAGQVSPSSLGHLSFDTSV